MGVLVILRNVNGFQLHLGRNIELDGMLHLRCNFNSADSSVDPDTPIELIPNLNPCYHRWPPTKSIINNIVPSFFESFSLFAILRGTVNYSPRF
jgi:hypothetical protein